MNNNMFEDDLDSILEEFSSHKGEKTGPVSAPAAKPSSPAQEETTQIILADETGEATTVRPDTVSERPKKRKRSSGGTQFIGEEINAGIGEDPGQANLAMSINPDGTPFEPTVGVRTISDFFEDEAEEGDQRPGRKRKKKDEEELYGEDRPRHRWILPLVLFIVLIGAVGGGTWYAANKVNEDTRIFPNVYIDGIDVGEKTEEEARAILEACNWEKSVSGSLEVRFPMEVTEQIDYIKAGVRMSLEDVLSMAVSYGRQENILKQLAAYINARVLPVDVVDEMEQTIVIDKEYVMQQLEKAADEFVEKTADNKYVLDYEHSKFSLLKGGGQIKPDVEEFYPKVEEALRAEEDSVIYHLGDVELEKPDFNKILDEVRAEPADAYYDKEKDEIIEEVVGVEFDPATASKIWDSAEPLAYVEIPMFTTPAAVTARDLKKVLFADVLGEFTTNFSGSTDNRISNINLAVDTINGIVLLPGERFSYNETLGERTAEKGYKEAAAYDNGDVIQALGGGICQVSSTLCVAVRMSLLDYRRTNHQFQVTYIDAGMDATVDYTGFENGKGVDFSFTNNKEYPIKIVCSCNNDEKTVTFQILGTDVDHYTVEFKNEFVGYLSHSDVNGNDDTHSAEWNSTRVGYMYDSKMEVYDADGNFVKEIYTYETDRCWYMYHKEDVNYPDEEPIDPSASESQDSGEGDEG